MSQTTSPQPTPPDRLLLPASLLWLRESIPFHAFIDCGADDNFIDSTLVEQAKIPTEPLESPREVNALNGSHLAKITHRTAPVTLLLSGNHREKIQFLVISSPLAPVVLGLPWLQLHNPHIDWTANNVSSWSMHCHSFCLRSAITASESCSPPPPTPPDLSTVPSEYHGLGEVFSKQKVLSSSTSPL